eukprot:GSA120T00014694001.1
MPNMQAPATASPPLSRWDYQKAAPKLQELGQFNAYSRDLVGYLSNLRKYGIEESLGLPQIKQAISLQAVHTHL